MEGFALYLVFLVPPLLFGLGVQWWLKKTFARYSDEPLATGLTGAQVARTILDRNGLNDVPVEVSPGGALSDHYDPRKKALFLSEPVYAPATVSAAAVAAHETGHALQDAGGYVPLRLRSAMFPAVAFASSAPRCSTPKAREWCRTSGSPLRITNTRGPGFFVCEFITITRSLQVSMFHWEIFLQRVGDANATSIP